MEASNPFEYVRPLAPGQVAGREVLTDELVRAVRARRLVALAGPRRFGKTSLLAQVTATSEQVDALDAVRVDCFGVASVGEFAVRLERSMTGLAGPARKFVQRLLESSEVGLSIAPGVGFKANFGRKDAPDPTAALHELLGTLVSLSERRGGLLLVLDEFQDADHVAGLDAILRSHLQEARQVAVLFAGSRPSLLRALFTDRARPFYSQVEVVEVGPLATADATAIIERGFAATGRDAGPVAEVVARTTEGHPQRLMLVAHQLWEAVGVNGVASPEHVGEALAAARVRTDPEHRAVTEALERTHRETLRALASLGSPYSRVAERSLDLSRGSVSSALKALEAEALLSRSDQRWRIVDPLLADWLRRNLPVPGS